MTEYLLFLVYVFVYRYEGCQLICTSAAFCQSMLAQYCVSVINSATSRTSLTILVVGMASLGKHIWTVQFQIIAHILGICLSKRCKFAHWLTDNEQLFYTQEILYIACISLTKEIDGGDMANHVYCFTFSGQEIIRKIPYVPPFNENGEFQERRKIENLSC